MSSTLRRPDPEVNIPYLIYMKYLAYGYPSVANQRSGSPASLRTRPLASSQTR